MTPVWNPWTEDLMPFAFSFAADLIPAGVMHNLKLYYKFSNHKDIKLVRFNHESFSLHTEKIA